MTKALPFRFGSEVYTWFMAGNGTVHANRLDHMIEVVAQAGFAGIQPIFPWMGPLKDPHRLADKLKEQSIELAALSLPFEWFDTEESATERAEADQAIELLQHFPGAILCTVQIPSGRHDLGERRESLIKIVNGISARAADKGIPCSFHPNSPKTSIIRTAEDYRVVLEGLDTSVTGWTPDVGHIINGGMDPLEVMQEYAPLINHVHYKDWDGEPEFALMGRGKVNLLAITQWLKDQNYSGWIVCEDEAEMALEEPDHVTLHDGRWIYHELIPALK